MIQLISKQVGNLFEISVIDKGIGFTNDQINKITAFKQFDRKVHEIGGSGLGLAIVKKMTQLYKGKFDIISGNDKQTCVSISIPIN